MQQVSQQLLLQLVLLGAAWGAVARPAPKLTCERINVEMCKELPYNFTSFPNLAGDETQKDASDALSTFEPLINYGCSAQLRFFLCSVYFPMCNEKVPFPIGPCRPLCETVKLRCLPLLKDFGFPWPAGLDCSRFPQENNNDAMCMVGPGEKDSPNVERTPTEEETKEKWTGRNTGKQLETDSGPEIEDIGENLHNKEEKGPLDSRHGGHSRCPPDQLYLNKTGSCVPLCSGGAHGMQGRLQKDRESASWALFILSLISVVLTSICLITSMARSFGSLHHTSSFTESSLLWCAAAFAGSSFVYLLSLLYREQISCTKYASHQLFIVSSVSHVPCTTAAALLYYFGTAGRLWWFVLACAWQSASSNGNHMERWKTHAKLLAWALPLAAVMVALVARAASADPLSGVCYVGAVSKETDSVFNLMRDIILVVACVVPLVYSCLVRIGRTSSINSSCTPNQGPSPSSAAYGVIGALYPIAALFYAISFGHDVTQPSSAWHRSWNLVSAIKMLFDPILGVISATACTLMLMSAVMASYRSPSGTKAGYVPAVPRIPKPEVPVGPPLSGPPNRSIHTYTSTPRNNTLM